MPGFLIRISIGGSYLFLQSAMSRFNVLESVLTLNNCHLFFFLGLRMEITNLQRKITMLISIDILCYFFWYGKQKG